MAKMIQCRCPSDRGGCGHIRGEAADGSKVRLQCRQCRIFFSGYVKDGRFIVTSVEQVRRTLDSRRAPGYIG